MVLHVRAGPYIPADIASVDAFIDRMVQFGTVGLAGCLLMRRSSRQHHDDRPE